MCSSHFSPLSSQIVLKDTYPMVRIYLMLALGKLTSHLGRGFDGLLPFSFIYFFISSLNARQNRTIKLLEILFTVC